jgi:hypothetical protein
MFGFIGIFAPRRSNALSQTSPDGRTLRGLFLHEWIDLATQQRFGGAELVGEFDAAADVVVHRSQPTQIFIGPDERERRNDASS